MRPSMMARKIGLKLPEWRGMPIIELLNEKEQEEVKVRRNVVKCDEVFLFVL